MIPSANHLKDNPKNPFITLILTSVSVTTSKSVLFSRAAINKNAVESQLNEDSLSFKMERNISFS